MAKRDQAIAMEAGRSPSGLEKAYAAAVASRKKLVEMRGSMSVEGNVGKGDVQRKEDENFGPHPCALSVRVYTEGLECG